MNNHDADTDRIAPHAARIGVFDRGVRTPFAECVESDEMELFDRIMSRLNTDERDCIRRRMKEEREDGANMAPERLIKFIVSFIGFMKADMPRSARMWGIIYLFDLSLHINGKAMSEKARELGITRATLSNAARDASELLKIPPSKWMRGEETVNNNRKARKAHCQ
jgi:DNA invertase Pin-like site-specific DNA recombinase